MLAEVRSNVLFTSTVYAVCAAIYVGLSIAVAWVAGVHIGTVTNVPSKVASDLGWAFGVLGVTAAALKALIPLETIRTDSSSKRGQLLGLGIWTLCLVYCWGAAVFAGMQLETVRLMPLSIVTFISAAWAVIEIGAASLPALTWIAFRRQAISRETQHATSSSYPPDLAGLLRSAVEERRPPNGLVGIHVDHDGTIVTTQSALAKALGQSKATIHRRLHALSGSGAITLATDAGTTRIRLPSLAQKLAA